LSFPFYEKKQLNTKIRKEKEVYLGDIIINLSKVKNKNNKIKFKEELNKLWIHGLLHLLGYDHQSNKKYLQMNIPNQLKYTKDHEWVKIDGEIATIGITDFAQKELGDIVYVEIELTGENLLIEEVFGTVEAVKTVSDLFMPLSGQVLEFNTALEDTPEFVNQDPYESGWMIKVKIDDSSQISQLLDSNAYLQLIQG